MALSVARLVIGLIPGGSLVGAALGVFAIVNSWCAMDKDTKNVAFRGKVSDIKNYLIAIIHEIIYYNDYIGFYNKGSPINGSIVGISYKAQLEGVIK